MKHFGAANTNVPPIKAACNYGAEKTPPKVIRVPHFRMLEDRNVRKEAGKGPDDFIFTRVDGEPIKDFRDAFHDLRRTGVRT
jgi:hypothetical protein